MLLSQPETGGLFNEYDLRGGVNRTVRESLGAIAGNNAEPMPLHPGTPSGKLSSSIPCQCTAVGSSE